MRVCVLEREREGERGRERAECVFRPRMPMFDMNAPDRQQT